MRWSWGTTSEGQQPAGATPAHLAGWEEFVDGLCAQFPNQTAGEAEVRRERIRAYVNGAHCDHDYRLVKASFSSGSGFHLKHQCSCCGDISTALKQGDFTDDEVAAAPERLDYSDQKRAWVLILSQAVLQRIGDRREPWEYRRDQHREFLQSPEWHGMRAKVMQRAKGICEGCLTEPATQVHHTERHKTRPEMAWELRAVCDRCHAIAEGLST